MIGLARAEHKGIKRAMKVWVEDGFKGTLCLVHALHCGFPPPDDARRFPDLETALKNAGGPVLHRCCKPKPGRCFWLWKRRYGNPDFRKPREANTTGLCHGCLRWIDLYMKYEQRSGAGLQLCYGCNNRLDTLAGIEPPLVQGGLPGQGERR